MRKIALLFITVFIFGCHSQPNTDQSDILNLIGEQYLKKETPKKIQENGIAIKSLNDQEYLKNFFSTMQSNKVLRKKMFNIQKDVINNIFNKAEIENYINQIGEIDFDKVKFENEKLRNYKSLEKERKQYQYYHVSISKPIFTKDRNYALSVSTTSHLGFLNIFSKKNGTWTYEGYYLIFP